MFLRTHWIGVSVLLVALCAVGIFLLRDETPKEPIKIYKVTTPAETPAKVTAAEVKQPSTDDTAGGGHFHADGTWHDGGHETPVESRRATLREPVSAHAGGIAGSAPAMNLTYHAKLLKSDPVEALRQQGQERGHWSADYLPDFPPDDMEAMEVAHAIYDYIYYGHTIPMSEHGESPEFQRAAGKMDRLLFSELNERYPMINSDGSYSAWNVRARHSDLKMLAWPVLPYDSHIIDKYRDYTYPSLIVRSHMYPDLPELGQRR